MCSCSIRKEICQNSFCTYTLKLKMKGTISSKYLCYRKTLEILQITTNIAGSNIRYTVYKEIIIGLDILHKLLQYFKNKWNCKRKTILQITKVSVITAVVNSIKITWWYYHHPRIWPPAHSPLLMGIKKTWGNNLETLMQKGLQMLLNFVLSGEQNERSKFLLWRQHNW